MANVCVLVIAVHSCLNPECPIPTKFGRNAPFAHRRIVDSIRLVYVGLGHVYFPHCMMLWVASKKNKKNQCRVNCDIFLLHRANLKVHLERGSEQGKRVT